MSKEFKIPQYTPLQLNSNISYGLTKENNISKDELDSVQWLCEAYEHQIKQISDLEAKLAEKDDELLQKEKKIQDLMLYEFVATTLDFNKLSADNCRLREQLAEHNQDKISFALEQLEKVKEFVKENESWEIEGSDYSIVYVDDVLEKIDNQIKAIKGEK